MEEQGDGRNFALLCAKDKISQQESEDKEYTMIRRKTSGRNNPAKSKSLESMVYTPKTAVPALFKYKTIHQEYFEDMFLNVNPISWCKTSVTYTWKCFYRVAKLNTRLLEAVGNGDAEEIDRLLKLNANPNATCRLTHVSVCHMAAMVNNDLLALLIKSGAERFRTDRLGRTPLHLAAWAGNPKQIAVLLSLPEEIQISVTFKMSEEILLEVKRLSSVEHRLTNTPCNIGLQSTWRPIWHDSIEHNCMQIKENLPVFGPGWTALHSACARAQHTCVQLLLAAGANPCARDYIGRAPLDIVGLAHYSGHKIDVYNFRETIRILLAAGGKFYTTCSNCLSHVNTPLHTAVELESLEAIEELLEAGASATCLNSNGLTAMHICVKKQLREHLQLLLENYKDDDQDSNVAFVDARDEMGQTVLHSAVKTKWSDGVCIALGAGANTLMMADDGESPIHSAAALGDTHSLQELLTVARYAIDHPNQKGQTALFVAIINNHLEIVKILIENGASISVTLPDQQNVLHVVAQHGYEEILEYILNYGGRATGRLINAWATYTPITYAVLNNFHTCVAVLLEKGALLDSNVPFEDHFCTKKCCTYTTDLHIAAAKNHYEVVEIILDFDSKAVNKPNDVGLLPLHVACSHGSRESIKLLIYKGADLSHPATHLTFKPTSMEILMNRLSKPTEFLEEIFDYCIFPSEEQNMDDEECEVCVNYQILCPNLTNMKQMKVIKALVETGNRYDQRKLLHHPLIESFLQLKWKALQSFFYFIIILYTLFVLSLNMYVVSVFHYQDIKNGTNTTASLANTTASLANTTASLANTTASLANTTASLANTTHPVTTTIPIYMHTEVWKYILYVTVSVTTLQEIIFITIRNKRYFLVLENWVKFGSIVLSMLLPSIVSWFASRTVVHSSIEWPRLIATITVLLTWLELTFLLSRFPNWGFYVLMFAKVAKKVFKILLTFMFLIIGFSLCFMIQFHAKIPFDSPWAAITKTLVMLMSEFDYGSMMDNKDEQNTTTISVVIQRLIFLTFVILAAIVLMNLMVGVAVNNVNTLEEIGHQMRLQKQVEFLASLEDIVWNKNIQKFLPEICMSVWKQVNVLIILGPEKIRGFPIHIKDAIFEKAKLRQSIMEEEQGLAVNYPIKLNEIHDAIVRLYMKVEQSEGTVNITTFNETVDNLNKRIEELHKEMINQLMSIKKLVDRNCNCKK